MGTTSDGKFKAVDVRPAPAYILEYTAIDGTRERSNLMRLCIQQVKACSPEGVIESLMATFVEDMGLSKARAVAALQAMVPVVARYYRPKKKNKK
jgi:hypothetical protein